MALIQKKSEDLTSLIVPFLIMGYWFYISVCFGYFLQKIVYHFLDRLNKKDPSKIIKLRKKFNFKNIIKSIFRFFFKLIKNWCTRVLEKLFLLIEMLPTFIDGLITFLKKVKSTFKSRRHFQKTIKRILRIFQKKDLKLIFRLKRIFQLKKVQRIYELLKSLFTNYWNARKILHSFLKELLFISSFTLWAKSTLAKIICLMEESVIFIRYFLYLIILGLIGIILGFLLGLYKYKRDKQIELEPYLLFILYLLEILYSNNFRYLLESNQVDTFSKFSLEVVPEIKPRVSKLLLIEANQKSQLPVPIVNDPFLWVELEFYFNEPNNFKFELFEFYQYVTKKIKH